MFSSKGLNDYDIWVKVYPVSRENDRETERVIQKKKVLLKDRVK